MSFLSSGFLFWAGMILSIIISFFVLKRKTNQAFNKEVLAGKKALRQSAFKEFQKLMKMETERFRDRLKAERIRSKLREKLLTVAEAAGLLNIKTKTLYNMRSDGKGPDSILLGGKPFYRQVDVERWQRAQGEGDDPGGPDKAPPDCVSARGGASAQ